MSRRHPDSEGLQHTPVEQQYGGVYPETYNPSAQSNFRASHAPEVVPQNNYAYSVEPQSAHSTQYHNYSYPHTNELAGQAPPSRAELPPLEQVSILPSKVDGSSPLEPDKPITELYGTEPPPKKYCGLRLRTLIIAIVVAVLIIAGAVGGAIGGILGKNKKNDATNNTDSGNNQSGNDNPSDAEPTPGTPFRAISATTCSGNENFESAMVFLAYQGKDGALNVNISPERLTGGGWVGWESVPDADVKMNSPVSIACYRTDMIDAYITYLRPSDSALSQAFGKCNIDGSGCDWTANQVDEGVKIPNATQFALTYRANWIDANNTLRLYGIVDGVIKTFTNKTTGWDGPIDYRLIDLETKNADAFLFENSGIAASYSWDETRAYWWGQDKILHRNNADDFTSTFADVIKAGEFGPSVNDIPTSMAAYYEAGNATYRLFWLEKDRPAMYTDGGDQDGDFQKDDAWVAPDHYVGPIAAASGNDTSSPARLFYVAGGEIVEYAKMGNEGWKRGRLPTTQYD